MLVLVAAGDEAARGDREHQPADCAVVGAERDVERAVTPISVGRHPQQGLEVARHAFTSTRHEKKP
ncbi:hypothetical protein ACFSTC_57095 [Nonomuraea ferruginea]